MTEGKFVWSESEIFNSGEFDTIEEALEQASEELEPGTLINIGKIKKIDLSINANRIIEDVQESAYNQADDVAEDFLQDITKEQEDDLKKMMTETFAQWLEENNLTPNFFSVVESKEYKIT